MRFSSKVVCLLAAGFLFLEMHAWVFAAPITPQVPETSVATATEEQSKDAAPLPSPQQLVSELTQSSDYPVELAIPAIKLDVAVINVGVNGKGEMDVPDGNTSNVGWYQDGTIPGNVGSAVFDAHVFAAFKNLRYVKNGDDIYVKTKLGAYLHFRAKESLVYKTSEVPLQQLFNQTDAPRLNLITCAGKLTNDHSTYDHRLIVYAVLVNK